MEHEYTESREERMTKWEEVHSLYQSGKKKEAGEKALALTDYLVQKYVQNSAILVKDGLSSGPDDLEQSLKLAVLENLHSYKPYVVNEQTGEKMSVTGDVFFAYYLNHYYGECLRSTIGVSNIPFPGSER